MKKLLMIFGLVVFLAGCGFGAAEESAENNNTNTEVTAGGVVSMTEEAVEIANEGITDTEEMVLEDPTESMTDDQVGEAKERDEQRIKDIEEIQEALEKYYEDNASYPETLDVLISDYIKELPTDPNTEEVYSYTPIGKLPAQFYDLVYELEAGVDDQDFGLQVVNPELK